MSAFWLIPTLVTLAVIGWQFMPLKYGRHNWFSRPAEELGRLIGGLIVCLIIWLLYFMARTNNWIPV